MDPESLFSLSNHLERLSQDGDPLEVLEAAVDFEYFRGWLVEGLGYSDGIGLARAEAKLTLANLAYNFDRLIFHERKVAIG